MSGWIHDMVSIITPMYNSERYIEDTINSVLDQTYTNWEMIIVDDASTDRSGEIVKKYVQRDQRIHLISLDHNQGIANARNIAIQHARGRYLAFLDSDDLWLSDKLSIQLSTMNETGCCLCFSGCYVIDQDGSIVKKERKVPYSVKYTDLLKGNVIPCLTVILDRSNYDEIVFKNIHHEDYAAWLSCLKKGNTAIGVQKPLAKYRISTQSVTSNKLKSVAWAWNVLRHEQELNFMQSVYYYAMLVYNLIKKWY